MYIKKVHINNIRSIKDFEMEFDQPAGWHVIIGENGSGKSTIVKAIALQLLGNDVKGLRINLFEWLNNQSSTGMISNTIILENDDEYYDKIDKQEFTYKTKFLNSSIETDFVEKIETGFKKQLFKQQDKKGWFSAAYGPFRRFTGGISTTEFKSHPKLTAHLSIFGEDVALTEALDWLVQLNYKQLEKKEEGKTLDYIKTLINSEDFLPHHAKLENVNSDGVFFKDGNGQLISVNELSDGYRSILSLTFELIRQMVRVYGIKEVFRNIENSEHNIPVSGVVLIDEIDAHLHPTWQTSIGQWFTKYFPRIQFIVTTHSPLICRAAENGSIWQLAAPGSNLQPGQITGLEKDKLVFGNILEAYGTEAFGASPVRSAKSHEKLERLGELNMLSALGKIDAKQEQERLSLQKTLSTDDPTGF